MTKKLLIAVIAGLLGVSLMNPALAAPPEVMPTMVDDHAPIVLKVRGGAGSVGSTATNMTWHGGPVMSAPVTAVPIFWGTKWKSSNTSWIGDKVDGMKAFYAGYGGSGYASLSTEYTDSAKNVTNQVSLGTAITDTTNASSVQSKIFNEVVNKVGFANLSNDGYYPVYTDLPRRGAGYCAWHSAGTVSQGGVSKTIKYAFFFALDGDSGCTGTTAGSSWSTATTALGSVSAHELAEAMTDPQLNAWYDSGGAENADKCAWQFSGTTTFTVSGVSKNWVLQGEWSNNSSGCKFSSN